MPIRQFFHLMQIVDDHDLAEARYAALLAPQVFQPKGWSDFDKRWASLAVIGPDFVLEIMEPSTAEADGNAPLPKFHARHGQHWHSMSWFVDPAEDLVALGQRMADRGCRVIDPYPPGLGGRGDAPLTLFTHPKDTFGQLEFQALTDHSRRDPHLGPDWTGSFWRDEHPLAIECCSHITTVVSDLDRARSFYEEVLEAPAFHDEQSGDRRSAFVMVGTETVVELAQPTGTGSRLGRDLAAHGEVPHSVTFTVADLGAVAKHAADISVRVADQDAETILLEPEDLFGALVGFTTRRLPGDPRR
jgi:catechol 2,3-dioxygenase-like lactoylglutathione lyase family enzyme